MNIAICKLHSELNVCNIVWKEAWRSAEVLELRRNIYSSSANMTFLLAF